MVQRQFTVHEWQLTCRAFRIFWYKVMYRGHFLLQCGNSRNLKTLLISQNAFSREREKGVEETCIILVYPHVTTIYCDAEWWL